MELNRQETDKWNAEIERVVGIGLTMLQRAELSNYFKSEVKKLTIPVVSNQREQLIAFSMERNKAPKEFKAQYEKEVDKWLESN